MAAPRKTGKFVDDIDCKLAPVAIPRRITDDQLLPFKKLAAAVLMHAVRDMVPHAPRKRVCDCGVVEAKLHAELAYDFLAGKGQKSTLDLWCTLLGVDSAALSSVVVADKHAVLRRYSQYSALWRRGEQRYYEGGE